MKQFQFEVNLVEFEEKKNMFCLFALLQFWEL